MRLVVGRHLGRTSKAALVGHSRHRTVGTSMTAWLTGLVEGRWAPGVYRWPSRAHPGAVGRELTAAGWGGDPLAGHEGAHPRRVFARGAPPPAFPRWVGHTLGGVPDC